jgi:hypothetical protein
MVCGRPEMVEDGNSGWDKAVEAETAFEFLAMEVSEVIFLAGSLLMKVEMLNKGLHQAERIFVNER